MNEVQKRIELGRQLEKACPNIGGQMIERYAVCHADDVIISVEDETSTHIEVEPRPISEIVVGDTENITSKGVGILTITGRTTSVDIIGTKGENKQLTLKFGI